MDVEFKRPKHKKRRRWDIQTDKLKVYSEIKSAHLTGVIFDTAVWLCVPSEIVKKLDSACFGNLDGGNGTATFIKDSLKGVGVNVEGDKAVRLSLDEAFFMHYALRSLTLYTVHDKAGRPGRLLDTAGAWLEMQRSRDDFTLLYLCYHHFRSKGWIPRTGLQYGVDFVLYQKHPAITHSDYSVSIQTDESLGLGSRSRPRMSWHDLQVTNRLTAQVGKRLLVARIHDPAPHLGYDHPKCMDRVSISEMIVRRWVPESDR
eukprot:jgi/Picsp_1/4700/NSC_02069-R1_trna intron endonuclease